MLLYDIETDGFLDVLTVIHCIVIYDTVTDQWEIYDRDHRPIEDGVRRLEDAVDGTMGHNAIRFDARAIKKLYPNWKPSGPVLDSLVYTRLLWPSEQVKDWDFRNRHYVPMPGNLIGRHSLEAWGWRLGVYKGDFGKTTDWKIWTPEMTEYCVQDVVVLKSLWERIQSRIAELQKLPGVNFDAAIELEHKVATIIGRQEDHGFAFDIDAAGRLHATLVEHRERLVNVLTAAFPPFWFPGKEFTPKADNKRFGYRAGAAMTKVSLVDFNPASAKHVTWVLKKKYRWQPTKFTEKTDEPAIDEEVLGSLPYPEAKVLAEMLMVEKRLGQLAVGKQAWLKQVDPVTGRMHGAVNTMGAVTYRMTHSNPNVAQVPKVGTPYGKECRSLFMARQGYVLVGCDAEGLEARCLAHFLAHYDKGAYVAVVISGKKEDGTDIHTVNMRALGIDSRDDSKTWFYAYMYGAGDEKLGLGKGKSWGAKLRAKFQEAIPAMGALNKDVKARASTKMLRGLDGRVLHVRSMHAALNTLLQSAGAIIMKKALVIMDETYQSKGWVPGKDYEFVANIHDEVQIECLPSIAEEVGRIAADSIRLAGEAFNFRCPLAGAFEIGPNWAATH